MSKRPPKYCRQREKGRPDRAYILIDGRKILLGVYGSKESRCKYAARIDQQPEPAVEPSIDPAVCELIVGYLEFAATYYRKPDGSLSGEYDHIREAVRYLRRLAGGTPARDFGPKMLKIMRQELIDRQLSRVYINAQIRRVVCLFRWAVEEELTPPAVYHALAAVRNLKRGRSKAKETVPVRPVDEATVEATLEYLPEVVADMVRVQLLTSMRPGEVCALRPCDLERAGEIWWYLPEHHKTEHHGHHRAIAVGPKAQAVLLRYLARAPDACCFQPRDSEAKRLVAQEAARKTPLSCGNRRGSNRVGVPKRKPGERYTVDSYRQAIRRAAKRANVEQWAPHRLRHTKATDIRKRFGLDAAQAVLGHRGAKVTEVYAELDQAKAAEVALRIG